MSRDLDPRGGPSPIPPPPDDVESWRPWLERLHASVGDLARDQADLHAQLAALLRHLEERRGGDAPPGPRGEALEHGDEDPGLGRRAGRTALAAVRAVRRLARRLWHSSVPDDVLVRIALDRSPPPLTLALLSTEGSEAAGALRHLEALTEWISWHPEDSRFRLFPVPGQDGKPLAEGHARDLAALAAVSGADVCAWHGPSTSSLGSGVLELALQVMAFEDLAFLHLRAAEGDVLLARWSWAASRLPADGAPGELSLDPRRLRSAPRGRILGRSVGLLGRPLPVLPGDAAEHLRRVGERWLAKRSPRRPIRHERALGLPGDAPQNGGSKDGEIEPEEAGHDSPVDAVVLTRPLGGGLDRLLAEILTPGRGRRTLLIQLAAEGFDPAHPVAAWSAPGDAEGIRVLPLGELVDAEDRPHVLARLLHHRPVRRLLHIGPGEGFFDRLEMGDLFTRIDRLGHLAFEHPARPGRLAAPPSGAQILHLPPTATAEALDLPDGATTRRRLGLPPDAVLAVHLGDLGIDERPEDLVTAVARTPASSKLFLLLAGRGPLGRTTDDLARFHGLKRYARLDVSPAEALAVADLVVSAGDLPLPWTLLAALRHRLPVVATGEGAFAESPLGRSLGRCGRVVTGGPGALADALEDLASDAAERRRLGDAGPGVFDAFDEPAWRDPLLGMD